MDAAMGLLLRTGCMLYEQAKITKENPKQVNLFKEQVETTLGHLEDYLKRKKGTSELLLKQIKDLTEFIKKAIQQLQNISNSKKFAAFWNAKKNSKILSDLHKEFIDKFSCLSFGNQLEDSIARAKTAEATKKNLQAIKSDLLAIKETQKNALSSIVDRPTLKKILKRQLSSVLQDYGKKLPKETSLQHSLEKSFLSAKKKILESKSTKYLAKISHAVDKIIRSHNLEECLKKKISLALKGVIDSDLSGEDIKKEISSVSKQIAQLQRDATTVKRYMIPIEYFTLKSKKKVAANSKQIYFGTWLGKEVTIELSSGNIESVIRELRVSQHIRNNKFIRSLYGLHISDDFSCIVMEPVKSLLSERLAGKSIALESRKSIALGILEGLEHLHLFGILHRELSTETVWLDRLDNPKIANLSEAKMKNNSSVHTTLKSSKEIFRDTLLPAPEEMQADSNSTEASDVHRFAVILWRLYLKKPPTEEDFLKIRVKIIADRSLKTLLELKLESKSIPNSIKDLIKRCFEKDPYERPSIKDIREILAKVDSPEIAYKNGETSHNNADRLFKLYKKSRDRATLEKSKQAYKRSQDYYWQAARAGHPKALSNLAFLFLKEGIDLDKTQMSLFLLELAEKRGHNRPRTGLSEYYRHAGQEEERTNAWKNKHLFYSELDGLPKAEPTIGIESKKCRPPKK